MKGQPVHLDFSLLAASKTCNTKSFTTTPNCFCVQWPEKPFEWSKRDKKHLKNKNKALLKVALPFPYVSHAGKQSTFSRFPLRWCKVQCIHHQMSFLCNSSPEMRACCTISTCLCRMHSQPEHLVNFILFFSPFIFQLHFFFLQFFSLPFSLLIIGEAIFLLVLSVHEYFLNGIYWKSTKPSTIFATFFPN